MNFNSSLTSMKNVICKHCKTKFKKSISEIKSSQDNFCSLSCLGKFRSKQIELPCGTCGKIVSRKHSQFKRSKSKLLFCNRSCSIKYSNTHKTTGTRISKFEIYLSLKLPQLFPALQILFNDKTTINSELDIYIPSLKLAFELNGIFHYEPIFGKEKLQQIQNNDTRKFQACLEHDIELVIIDVSSIKYVKEQKVSKFVDIITTIIHTKLNGKSWI